MLLRLRRAWAWLAAALPGLAAAAGWSASAGVLSDKVVYGLSQSGGRPVAVLDLSWSGPSRLNGAWAFSAGLASLGGSRGRGDAELSLGIARGGPLGDDGAWQAAFTRYENHGAAAVRRPGYQQLALSYAWGESLQVSALALGGLAGPAADGGRRRGSAAIVEAGWHRPLAAGWALDIGLGQVHYRGLAVPAYRFGSAGLSWSAGTWQVFATRAVSNSVVASAARSRAVVSVLWNF